jgi:hypothetical protein
MFKSVARTLSVLLAAAVIVGSATVLSPASEKTSITVTVNAGKGDRLDAPAAGPKCSEQAWPYYEAACLKGQIRSVRIVTSDRISATVSR